MPLRTEVHDLLVGPANPDGKQFGSNASDPIGFYGATPVVQPASANQQAIPGSGTAIGTLNQSGGAGALAHYTSTQSPSSVATVTTAEQAFTVTGVVATDLVILNKPTVDAGLGLLASRVSAANTVQACFVNVTAGSLTPTTSQGYLVTTIPANLQMSAALTVAAVTSNTTVEQTFTVAGVAPGMIVHVNKPTTNAGVGVMYARASANNQIALGLINATAGTLTPTAAETYEVVGFNALAAASNLLTWSAPFSPASVATVTTGEQNLAIAGVQAADIMIGVQKPTTQAGLFIAGARVSGAGTVSVAFGNVTAGSLTPTASEVYGVTVFRPAPAAPMSLLTTATLTPTSVAANTTAEQTFTVTGLVSGNAVVATPNFNITGQPGIGIAGVRISATNTLAVCFVNTTAGTLTPAAGTWTVAHFNTVPPTAGQKVSMLVSPLQSIGASLMNANRSALTSLGLIAGA